MSPDRPPLAAFEDDVIETAATETAVDAERVRTLVERHQERVRELPGVEDIVYEWRSQFHEDPLVDRSSDAYVLAHRPHVWDEFASDMDLDDDELTVLRAVHERQARSRLGQETAEAQLDGGDPMVLTRP